MSQSVRRVRVLRRILSAELNVLEMADLSGSMASSILPRQSLISLAPWPATPPQSGDIASPLRKHWLAGARCALKEND